MSEEANLEHVLGGISALYDELKQLNVNIKQTNTWLHKLYNIDMTMLAEDSPGVFERINLVHNELKMFMEDDWEDRLQ